MNRKTNSSFTIRKLKVIFTIFVFILVSFVISSYFVKGQKKIKINQIAIGDLVKNNIFPIYKNSILSLPMSQTGNPFIYVFLSKDRYELIVDFYKKSLKDSYSLRKIEYKKMMTIYQFISNEEISKRKAEENLLKGKKKIKILNDYILKGIEIIPLNHLWQRVLNAKTKIKIIIPRNIIYMREKSNKK